MSRSLILAACLSVCWLTPARALELRELADAAPLSTPAQELRELAMTFEPENEDATVVLLLEQAHASYDEAGRRTWQWHFVHRILNEDGMEYLDSVEATWEPWHQSRPLLRARVIGVDGSEHSIEESELLERPAWSGADDVHVDRRILAAVLPKLAPGVVVEQHVTITDDEPAFAAGTNGWYRLGNSVRTEMSRLTLVAPKSVSLKHRLELAPELEMRVQVRSGLRVASVECSPCAAGAPTRSWLPPDVPRAKGVRWSTGQSWQAIATAYSKIVDGRIDEDRARALAAEILGSEKRPRVAAQLALDWIAGRVRYTGLELGEAALIPTKPQDCLDRGFGDCKDQSTLLVAILRAAGIPSSVALLKASFGQDTPAELPGVQAFNHAIVHVGGADPFWIDPTAPNIPVAQLPAADQGRLALIASAASTGLVLTPVVDAGIDRIIETIEATPPALGNGTLTETTEAFGRFRRSMGESWAQSSKEELEEGLEAYSASAYSSKSIEGIEVGNPDDPTAAATLVFRALQAARLGADASVIALGMAWSPSLAPLNSVADSATLSPEERAELPKAHAESDYWLPLPFTWERTFILRDIPEGFRIKETPEKLDRTVGPLTVTREWTLEDGTYTARQVVRQEQRRVSPEQWKELRTWLRETMEDEESSIIPLQLENEAYALTSGPELAEGVARLREELTDERFAAAANLRLGLTLINSGLVERSIHYLERATELAPDALVTWRVLGWALTLDPIGLSGSEGSASLDLERGLESLEHALEIEPQDNTSRRLLLDALRRPSKDGKLPSQAQRRDLVRVLREQADAIAEAGGTPGAELHASRIEAAVMLCDTAEIEAEVERDPDGDWAHGARAAVLLDRGDQTRALRELKRLPGEALQDRARQALFLSGIACRQSERTKPATELRSGRALKADLVAMLNRDIDLHACSRRAEELPLPAALQLSMFDAMSRQDEAAMRALFPEEGGEESEPIDFVALIAEGFRGALGEDRSFLTDWIPATNLVNMTCPTLGSESVVDVGWAQSLRLIVQDEQRDLDLFGLRNGRDGWILASRRATALRAAKRAIAIPPKKHAELSDLVEETARLLGVGASEFQREGEGAEHQRLVALTQLALILRSAGLAEPCSQVAQLPAEAWPEDEEVLLLAYGAAMGSRDWTLGVRLGERLATLAARHADLLLSAQGRDEAHQDQALKRLEDLASGEASLPTHQLVMLAGLLQLERRHGEAAAAYRRVLAREDAPPGTGNQLAWLLTIQGEGLDEAERLVEQSLDGETGQRSASLHTLATIRAARGKVRPAIEALRQAVAERPGGALESHDRYVLGLIAETLGEVDEARRQHQLAAQGLDELPEQDRDDPIHTGMMALRRLKDLEAVAAAR